MFTVEEIIGIVKRTSSIAIEADRQKKQRYDSKVARLYGEDYAEVIPDYYEGYEEGVENYEAIKVHSEKSCFPARLFANRAPNQTEEAAYWIKDNYKNVTLPVFMDFYNTVLRCTHDQNWSITFQNEKEEYVDTQMTFEKYLSKGIKEHGSIETFFKQIMFALQLKDAMGVIAVKPHNIPLVNIEGEYFIDSTKLIEPQPIYYTSKQVVGWEERYCLIETNEHSIVEYYGAEKNKGRVYEFYDDENIWICKQIGKYVDNQFEISLYYNHGMGEKPVTRLRGIPTIDDGKIIYQSPFLFATDLLDLVAQNSAYKQASIAKCVFPATVMLGDICEFEQNGAVCNDGVLAWNDDDGNYHSSTCPNCHGAGLVSRLGALETMLIKPEVRGQNESELRSSQEPLKYISPEVHTLEFLESSIEKTEQKARKILHLQTSNTVIKGYEDMTATGMSLDMKAAFAFIMPIAQTAFENFEFIIDTIGWMRYKTDFIPPIINYPQTFDIGTEKDILTTISFMVKNEVPNVLIHAEIFRYLKSVFYTDEKTTAIYQLLISSDRLLTLGGNDVMIKQSKGLVEDWEIILHDSFMSFVDELMLANPNFLKEAIEVQKATLIDFAKAKANTIVEATKIKMNSIDSML